MKTIFSFIGMLLAFLALIWVIQGNNFFMYKFFGIKYENTRRQIFEQSRAFNQGMVQELENMQVEYNRTTDPESKKALASIILHRASGYNLNDPIVSGDLRDFIYKLRQERLASK